MQNQASLERCSCLYEAFSAFGPLRLALSGKLILCVTRKSDTVRQADRNARPCYGIDSVPGRCRVPTETTTGLARGFSRRPGSPDFTWKCNGAFNIGAQWCG